MMFCQQTNWETRLAYKLLNISKIEILSNTLREIFLCIKIHIQKWNGLKIHI